MQTPCAGQRAQRPRVGQGPVGMHEPTGPEPFVLSAEERSILALNRTRTIAIMGTAAMRATCAAATIGFVSPDRSVGSSRSRRKGA